MARKSRVNGNTGEVVSADSSLYRVGIYGRLSSENSGEDTLENQLFLLKSYVEAQEDMKFVDTYSDFGHTGTRFDRPAFERLMTDAKSGRINCIVVKDLSRLGRNFIETGNLVENIFPFLGIRFVAVTDGFDTISGDGLQMMVAAIKNLVNEVYAKDISRKIITTFRTKQRKGEFLGSVPPFGYLRSKENKNQLVVDETAAPIVRRIFRMYADGKGLNAIAQTLEGEGIECPRKYHHRIGLIKSEKYEKSLWCNHTINAMLTNRAYIGEIVQGKVKQELCNNLPKMPVDKKDWIIVPRTHKAIVDHELFLSVQDIHEARSRANLQRIERSQNRKYREENILKGYLRCGHCGKSMNLIQNIWKGIATRKYLCDGYQKFRSVFCSNKDRIDKDELEKSVLECIRACIRRLMDEGLLQEKSIGISDDSGKVRLGRIGGELKSIDGKLADLYQDRADGILDDSDYMLMRKEFLTRKKELEGEKQRLIRGDKGKQEQSGGLSIHSRAKKYQNRKKLDRSMVEVFVESIRIFEGKKIEVTLLDDEDILKRLGG